MAFEVFRGRIVDRFTPVEPGTASLSVNGHARFARDDLASVDITESVTILVDRERRQIGLRKPGKGESPRAVGDTRVICIGSAMQALSLSPRTRAGLYEIKRDGNALILDFSEAAP